MPAWRRLAAAGWDVHVLLRAASIAAQLEEGVTVHRFDGDTAALVRILANAAPDAVFHLAAAFVAGVPRV